MSSADRLIVRGAREHNLKNVSLDLPRNSLIVFTGLSGSGKSSLAFDTIFAEGQRRYVESLSAYARQFLGQMDKPDVDFIEGLSPAVSIDQKSTNRNPRSTVGTITEVYDYLRLLFARAGKPHCPKCGKSITKQTPQHIVDQILALPQETRFQILAPIIRARKGEFVDLFKDLLAQGYSRARVDGATISLSEPPKLKKQEKHTIEVVIDRLTAKPESKQRLTDSITAAMLEINHQLRSLKTKASYLNDLATGQIGGKANTQILYERAIHSAVAADINEKYRAYDSTQVKARNAGKNWNRLWMITAEICAGPFAIC